MGKIIGIDLGTTNSCVSVLEGGEPTVIANSEGRRTTPSIIAFIDEDGKQIEKVGDSAKRQAITNALNTIYEVKRLMGMSFAEAEKLKLNENTAYEIVDNKGKAGVKVNDKIYTPEELSAKILQKIKSTAEDFLGDEVTQAVITVPAYFNDSQRNATKLAGEISGLEVLRVINEPTAAALAYGLNNSEDEKTIIVFDFGGGTHDVSVLELGDNVFQVQATNGDTHLGGGDIDNIIVDFLVEQFQKNENTKIDLKDDAMAHQRLKEAAEKAKIELSSSPSTDINLPYIMPIDGVPKHLVTKISVGDFNRMIDDIVKRTIEPCKVALKDAGLKPSDIDDIILVGGSTRIPAIQDAVTKFFGKEPSKAVNPDEAVSIGAGIQGGVLTGDVKDVLLLDVTSMSLGIETKGGVTTKMVEVNTTIPVTKTETFSTAVANQPSVEIHILQGERIKSVDNKSLGKFTIDGIPPAPAGTPKIEVTFDIDANGILKVSAEDTATGTSKNLVIKNPNDISDEEIERMKQEAEANAEADKQFEEEMKAVNKADSLIFQTEKTLNEHGESLSEEVKTKITGFVDDLKVAKENKDIESINSLEVSLQEAVTAIYQDIENQKQQTNESEENAGDSAENVDFEEVDNEEESSEEAK